MTFRLACGDVMPGCAATFEADDKDDLLAQVAEHAADDHGLTDLDDETVAVVESKIQTAA